MIGNEFKIVDTKLDMFGIELIVLKGLINLTTLNAAKFSPSSSIVSLSGPTSLGTASRMNESHPSITTMKSRIFQESLKYECGLLTNPIATTFKTISIV